MTMLAQLAWVYSTSAQHMRSKKSKLFVANAAIGVLLVTTGVGQNLSSGVLTNIYPGSPIIASTNNIPLTNNIPYIRVPGGQGRLQVDVGYAVGYSFGPTGMGSLIPGFVIELSAQFSPYYGSVAQTYSGYFIDQTTVVNNVITIANPPQGTYYFDLATPPSDFDIGLYVYSYLIRATYFPHAPVITAQPQNASIPVGGSAIFGVTATGTNLIYQWRKNSIALGGANSATYILYSVVATDAGSYDVIVSNSGGAVTSKVATLTVPTPPTINVQPQNVTAVNGQSVTFQVTAVGTAPLTYQWQKNGSGLVNGGHISGATTATLTLTSTSPADAGGYGVVVANSYGNATSGLATLTVDSQPSITSQPSSQSVPAGGSANFNVAAVGTAPLTYQWQKNGSGLVNGGHISGATTASLTITDIADSDAANYSVVVSNAEGSVLSSAASLTLIDPPSLAVQLTNLLVLAGSTATFSFSSKGSTPLQYQWRFNSTDLLDATNTIYTIPLVGTNNAGNYSVVVSNPAGSVTSSNAVLTVILSPTSLTNYASSTATFTVTAVSPESLSYQWQKNGAVLTNGGTISGATSTTLSIAGISDADAANYRAVVSDGYCDITTSNATLAVNDSLFIATQPLSQTVGAGSTATFTARIYGAPPFVFQWFFNGTPIGSLTADRQVASLTLTNVRTNQAGNYTVQVLNSSGSLTSANAVLTVVPPPTLALQILVDYPVLSLYGALGHSFMVQYNTNLAGANWINLSLINLSANPYQFLDPSGVVQPARFYRAFFVQ